MKNDEMKKFVESIQNKLGKENSSIIADDLATLLSDNITMNKTIEDQDNTIREKEELNQKLVVSNSSLLQQVGVPEDTPKRKPSSSNNEDDEEKISWDDCFDSKGKFLK